MRILLVHERNDLAQFRALGRVVQSLEVRHKGLHC